MHYICLDTETTGLDPLSCQILEVGAVFADTALEEPIGRPFRVVIDNGTYIKGQPVALQRNAWLLKEIADKPAGLVKPIDLVGVFNKWREEVGALECRNVGGKNYAGFDSRFLQYVPYWAGLKFRHRVLDPSMLWVREGDGALPSLLECAIRAKIDMSGFELHTAVDDCRLVVACIHRGLL